MLRIGKIQPSVLRRSVLRLIHDRDGEAAERSADAAEKTEVLPTSASAATDGTVLTVAPVSGPADVIGIRGVTEAVNGLAAAGAEPGCVMLSLLLPQKTDEAVLRGIIGDAERTCRELGIHISGGHTEVTDAVRRPVLSVTGIGRAVSAAGKFSPADKKNGDNSDGNDRKRNEKFPLCSALTENEDLILTKDIALEATWLLVKEKRRELDRRFTGDLLDTAEKFGEKMSVLPEMRVLRDHPEAGATSMYDVSRGGIFGALWEFADLAGIGMDVDIRQIPIRQETVEICEYFDVNPYEALSGGAMLIASENGEETVRILRAAGIPAQIMGRTTAGPQRILHNGEEVRYLDRPQPDSLLRIDGIL